MPCPLVVRLSRHDRLLRREMASLVERDARDRMLARIMQEPPAPTGVDYGREVDSAKTHSRGTDSIE
jgi:hypothetical protein